MSSPFVGEVRWCCFSRIPSGWVPCDGRLLTIESHEALFAAIGTAYGGDGRHTFAVPDLEDRAPMGDGAGEGLTARELGEEGGEEHVTLGADQMPEHAHRLQASTSQATERQPHGQAFAAGDGVAFYRPAGESPARLASGFVNVTGGGQPHQNMQPYVTFAFYIATAGVQP